MRKTLFALLFSAGYSHHSKKKINKNLAQMERDGWGIRVINKDMKAERDNLLQNEQLYISSSNNHFNLNEQEFSHL
jgi:hypothetical protein